MDMGKAEEAGVRRERQRRIEREFWWNPERDAFAVVQWQTTFDLLVTGAIQRDVDLQPRTGVPRSLDPDDPNGRSIRIGDPSQLVECGALALTQCHDRIRPPLAGSTAEPPAAFNASATDLLDSASPAYSNP